MFKVRSLVNGEVRTVYAVSGTHFLLWHGGEDGHWEWRGMEQFRPLDEETMTAVEGD